jgi:hypothetical protein
MQTKLNKKLKGLEVFRTITIIKDVKIVSEDENENDVDGIDHSKDVKIYIGILHNGIVGYNIYFDNKLIHNNYSFIDNETVKNYEGNLAIVEDAYQFIDENIGLVCYGEDDYYNPILYAPELRELYEKFEILSKADENIDKLYSNLKNYNIEASIKLIFGGKDNDSKLNTDELEYINNLTFQFKSCKYLHTQTSKFIFNKENLLLIKVEFEEYYNDLRKKFIDLENKHFEFDNNLTHKLWK